MICPNCKKVYTSRIKYCISCGTELVPDENGTEMLPDDAIEKTASETDGIFKKEDALSDDVPHGFVRKINTSAPAGEKGAYEPVPIKKSSAVSKRMIGRRIAAGTASAALSVLLTAALVLMFGTIAGRELTDEKNIASGIKSVDLLSVPVSEIDIMFNDDYNIPPDATLEEAVAVMTVGSGVTGGNIRSIYESSTIGSFLNTAVVSYAEYLRSGTQPERITADKVKEILSENISVINKNTGQTLSDSDIALAYSEIERSSGLFDNISVSSLESRAGNYIRLARAYISVPALAAEAAAAVVLAAVIILLNGRTKRTPRYIGIPLLAAGLAAMVFTFMFSMQIGVFGDLSGLEREIAKGASAAASDGMYRAGAAFLFTGAAAVIASAIKTESKV